MEQPPDALAVDAQMKAEVAQMVDNVLVANDAVPAINDVFVMLLNRRERTRLHRQHALVAKVGVADVELCDEHKTPPQVARDRCGCA